jgi:hypothetical protein
MQVYTMAHTVLTLVDTQRCPVLEDGASMMNLFSVSFCRQRGEENLENFELLDRTD